MSVTAGIFTAISERNSEGTVCRLCMKNNNYYYNIFTSSVAYRITVEDALNDLIGLQVAVGDGLPTTLCPLCLKKLTELSVFKMTCLESDARLRKISGSDCLRSIQGDEASDDELRSSADTKDFIEDEIQGSSGLTCSVQRTEIYIPVSDSQQPGANMLETLKEENEDPLSEGKYTEICTLDPAGISRNTLDPLATDELKGMGTCGSPSVKADQFSDDGSGYAHNNSTNGATNDLVSQASDQPIDTEDGELVQNPTMAMASMTEAEESPVPERASALFAGNKNEREVRISLTVDGKSCTGSPHTAKKPYSCGECDKSFPKKSRLVLHIRTHTKEKPYPCNECDKSFLHKSSLVIHIRTHTKEKPYSCNECDKSFSQKGHLVYHMRTHTKEKPYSCYECDKSFSQKSILVSHIRTHSKEKPYSCNECDKSFSQKSTLVRHIRTHTKEKPYSCNECDKSFSEKSHLVSHIRTHTKEKPFPCNECGKSFTDRSTLVRHIRTHAKEKPYSCNKCVKSFSRKSYLVCHMRTHIKEKPYPCNECD